MGKDNPDRSVSASDLQGGMIGADIGVFHEQPGPFVDLARAEQAPSAVKLEIRVSKAFSEDDVPL